MSSNGIIANDGLSDVFDRVASERGLQSNSIYHKEFKTYYEMAALLQTHWIFQAAVTLEPFHMVRKFRQITTAPEGFETITKKLEIKKTFFNATRLAKTYGGAIVVMIIDDGLEPIEPLDITKIRKDGLKKLEIYEKPLLSLENYNENENISATSYTHYRINTDNPLVIHKSRVLEFEGDTTLSSYISNQTEFLGNSVIYKLYDVLIADSSINDIFANLPIRLNQPVLKTNLQKSLAKGDEGLDEIYNRLNIFSRSLSLHKIMIVDKENEDIDTVGLDSNSITELDKSISSKAAKVLNIPELVLLGTNPTGIGATGESGLTLFYDKIEAAQTNDFDNNLEKLDKVIAKASFNSNEAVLYEWIPLYHKSKKVVAETEQIHINNADKISLMFSEKLAIAYLKKKGVFDEELEQIANEEMGLVNE